jgi:putative transposase
MMGFAAEKLMALEVGAKTGAGYGEKNGFDLPSVTAIATGTGRRGRSTVERRIPKLRTGSYFPSLACRASPRAKYPGRAKRSTTR